MCLCILLAAWLDVEQMLFFWAHLCEVKGFKGYKKYTYVEKNGINGFHCD